MNNRHALALFAIALTGFGCSQNPAPVADDALAKDHYTFADVDQFVTDHLHLNLAVDFDSRELHGSATLNMRRVDTSADEITLDTRDLTIENVRFILASGELLDAAHRLGDVDDQSGEGSSKDDAPNVDLPHAHLRLLRFPPRSCTRRGTSACWVFGER